MPRPPHRRQRTHRRRPPRRRAAPPAPAAAGGLTDEAVDQLTKLAALHQQGVLTDEEFAAEKAKLLGL